MRGLEIGGGPAPQYPKFEQFDAIDWSERTQLKYTLGDARKLPYRDFSFDRVFASNLLEHFPEDETVAILTEWLRVVRRDGVLEIVVPDAMGILRDYFRGVNPSWDECAERLLGSQDYEGNRHFRAFTLTEFPREIEAVPRATLWSLEASHRGGGIRAVIMHQF